MSGTVTKNCGGCGRKFESKFDSNFCQTCIDDDSENEITDCPNCQRTYDDADADFMICHHCGYDAENKTFKKVGNGRRDISRVGIDPDARLDDWS